MISASPTTHYGTTHHGTTHHGTTHHGTTHHGTTQYGAILTMALLTIALLTVALLTKALLTMALLTMALLTMAPLILPACSSTFCRRGTTWGFRPTARSYGSTRPAIRVAWSMHVHVVLRRAPSWLASFRVSERIRCGLASST